MTGPTVSTVQCPRCRVIVPVDQIDVPNRCPDKTCPLKESKP